MSSSSRTNEDPGNHPATDAPTKVEEYTHFLDHTLKPQLREAKRRLDETEEEIQEYTKLLSAIQQLYLNPDSNDETHTGDDKKTNADPPILRLHQERHPVVDLGYQTVYCRARVRGVEPTPTKVFVHLGLGFHAELEPREATEFCGQRIDFLRTHQLHPRQRDFTRIQDHFTSSVNILQELERVRDRS